MREIFLTFFYTDLIQCSKFYLPNKLLGFSNNVCVQGNASNAEDSADYITVNFGLFSGHKEKNRGTKINTDLSG